MAQSKAIRDLRGIILAGGSGTRLYPATEGVSKQLLPIYNKPMVYYPLSVLMMSGIQNVLVITTPHDQAAFQRLLGDGSTFGMNISYAVQPRPEGLAQSFLIGKEFIGRDRVALVLGDNLYFGHGLPKQFRRAAEREEGATIFCYAVKDATRYGVAELGADGRPVSLEEKPRQPRSNWAITGLYYYDNSVVDIARELKPSPRGELEITDLNRVYLERAGLHVEKIGRGVAWFDTGTFESLLQASIFVQAIEERQGLMVGCPEEVAFRNGFIGIEQLKKRGADLRNNSYGEYLLKLAEEH